MKRHPFCGGVECSGLCLKPKPVIPDTPDPWWHLGRHCRPWCFPWSWHLSHEASISDNLLFPACLERELSEGRKPASLFTVEPQAFRNCFRRREADTESQALCPTPPISYPSFAIDEALLIHSLLGSLCLLSTYVLGTL